MINIKTVLRKMDELKGEIGLTDDDITIMLFTSLDHDHLTDLICLPGELLKWMTMDFAGESTAEADFLASKLELWEATLSHANAITAAAARLDGSKDQILEHQWWERTRYDRLGRAIADKLKANDAHKKALRALFKSYSDKLSYHAIFHFLAATLGIKLEPWEAAMLEDRLDRLGMAFVEFNEFNEFGQAYGLDWGEPLLENDLEDQLEKKLNLSYKDYKVTEADYFQGCKSMLTSERAALAVASKLFEGLEAKGGGARYLDPDFGPKDGGDAQGNAKALYTDGKPPAPGYPEPATVEWVRAEDVAGPATAPKFVAGGAGANDVRQGALGDCWFIGALSVIVTRDELLTGGSAGMQYDADMIIDKEIAASLSMGVYPPIFHRFRLRGIYVLRFFKNFSWIYVVVDDRLPVNAETKKPVFGSCVEPRELWVPLIEKAYAKLHGCYGQLVSGYIDEGIFEMTALQPEKILIRDEKSGDFPHKMVKDNYGGEEGFWKFLVARDRDGCLMGCSIKGQGKEGTHIGDDGPTGLIMNHAYGLNDVIELKNPAGGQPIRLLRIRNPWGNSEWNGAWGSGSEELEEHQDALLEYVATLPPDERFPLEADDGTFFMEYSEWKDIFSTLFLNVDFPDVWTGVRFKSAWTKQNSGGLPNKMSAEIFRRYAKNPQFYIRPEKACEVMFAMSQTGGRLPRNGVYYAYPYKEDLHYANVSVFQLAAGEACLAAFDKKKA